jgi:predicted AAA+ superfamily ATPase
MELISHPVAGAFWEGYAIEQIVTVLPSDIRPYYYRTHNGAELDLVLERNGKPIIGFEMKFSSSPVVSKGMLISMSDLGISKGFIITPSDNYFKVNSQITVMSLRDFLEEMKGMTEFRN